jgi:hypothetical protein
MWRITPKFDLQTLLIIAYMNVITQGQPNELELKVQCEMTGHSQALVCQQ